ncbi:hypothetical protein LTR95_000759 [Oleoguttula sp. CCFEE 5521]
MAHELGHAIGLLHEHQRSGMYDILNHKDPTVILSPQYIEGYSAAFANVSKTTEQAEPAFKDLDNPARINILTIQVSDITNDVQVSEEDVMFMGLSDGGRFDNQSVMLYNGYDGCAV